MFILFAFDPIAPRGGWYDFVGMYATREEAKEIAVNCDGDWHIIDEDRRSVVENGRAKR